MSNFPWVKGKEYDEIIYETYDGIAKITINRPECRNAFTPKTNIEMYDAFSIARDDASYWCNYSYGRKITMAVLKTKPSAQEEIKRSAVTVVMWARITFLV